MSNLKKAGFVIYVLLIAVILLEVSLRVLGYKPIKIVTVKCSKKIFGKDSILGYHG